MTEPMPSNETEQQVYEHNLDALMAMSDHLPGGFFVYHADGDEELIFANKAMVDIFGCRDMDHFKELTGFTFPGLVHPDDIDRVERIISEQIEASPNDMDYVEYRITRADGDVRWIMDYGHFVRSKNLGDIFYVFVSDSTEMRLDAIENKRRSDVIRGLAYSYDTIMLLDLERFEVTPYVIGLDIASPIKEPLQGRDEIQQAFENYADTYVVEHDRTAFLQTTDFKNNETLLEQGSNITFNYQVLDDMGNEQWMRLSLANVEDENSYTRIVIGFKNVTKQVTALQKQTAEREKILQERDEALQLSSMKSSFLFNMSHDVRTPLNAIVGFATLARKAIDDPAQVSECLDAIDFATDQLVNLVDSVMDMSQIESGSLKPNLQTCSIESQMRFALNILANQIIKKGLVVEEDIDTPNVNVISDPLIIRSAVLKVLDNAVKYSRQNGTVRFSLKGTMNDSGAVDYVITISDDGIGMSEAFLTRIFDSFERESNTTQSGLYGSGLGLSISKALLELLGGSIDIGSTKGEGTTATIRFSAQATDEMAERKAEVEGMLGDSNIDRLKGKRVLIVEDNELNRMITESIMTDAGLEVESVVDGAEAVRTIRYRPEHYYDLVLMDIQMPVMNGYDATRAIRSINRDDIEALPIVAVSANTLQEDRDMSIASGMNAHFAKPIDVEKLLNVLSKCVE